MKLKQSSHSLTSQVSDGDMTLLTELTEINIRISLWYEAESDAIFLLSRSEDINLGEKVCIYHHGLHKSLKKISTILKLSTPDDYQRAMMQLQLPLRQMWPITSCPQLHWTLELRMYY